MILGFVPGLLEPFMPFKAAVLSTAGFTLLVIAAIDRLASRGGSESAPTLSARLVTLAVLAWVASAFLSCVLNPPLRLGLFGEIEQREGALTLLGIAGLFTGVRRSHREPGHIGTTIDVLVVSASAAASYALIQFAGRDPLPWANAYGYTAGGATVARPSGTLGNPILLGAILAPALALAIARLASGRDDPWRVTPMIALLSAALCATLSRGAWLAGAIGGAASLAGIAVLDGRRRWIAGAALAALVPVGLFLLLPLRTAVLARLDEHTLSAATSIDVRAEFARGALSLWRSHPWVGVGPDAFGLWFPTVQTPALWRTEWHGIPVHAHSVVFQTLATIGSLGALAGLAWILATLLAAVDAWHGDSRQRAPVAGMLAALAALIVAGITNVVGLAGAACFAVLSGLLVASASPGSVRAVTPRADSGMRMAAAGTALVMIVMSIGALPSHWFAGHARGVLFQVTATTGAARDSLVGTARQSAWWAATRTPVEDQLWRLACDASLADGDGEGAEHAARRAIALVPQRASNLERLGSALALQARADEAFAAFDAARRLAPADGRIMISEARSALVLDRPDRALTVARRISALYPDAAVGHSLQGAALIRLGRPAEARAELQRAVTTRWEPGLDSQRPAVMATLAALDRADSLRTWQQADSISRASRPASR